MAKKKQDLTPEERLAAALVPEEEWPYALPDGWKWVRLGKIFIDVTNSRKKIKQKAYLPEGKWPIVDQGQTFIGGYSDIDELVYTDTLPVIIFGDHTRNVKYIDFKFIQGADGVKVLKPQPFINSKFLFWLLRGVPLSSKGYRRHFPILKKMVAPLPPLSEQHRLVARIESLFAKLDAAREKVQSVLDSHETRKAALLHDAFTGKLTAKWREEQGISLKDWQKKPLKECGSWTGGGTPSKSHPEYWENGNIMWITSKDMKSDVIQDTQLHITSLGVKESSAIYSENPAILFVMRSGILRHTLPVAVVYRPFTVNQDLKVLTPKEEIDVQYLLLAAKAFSGQILKTCMKNGTTVESINSKKLMDFSLPIASMQEQKVIAKKLQQLLDKEQRARQAAEETLAAIDRMKQAILARAFRGEL